ncbi:MAG: NAD(P)H-dependent glycerol-3-phosphate dehydrogenase [Ginsengibacter sp.]
MQPLHSLTIIGGGSWATALVKIFSESSINVKWHLRSQEYVDFLMANGRNPNYLSFLQLNLQYIQPTCIIEEAINESSDIIFAVPSAFLESSVSELDPEILRDKRIYVSIKGLVSDQLLIPTVFLQKRFNLDRNNIYLLAGPCHAEEIAMDRKTYLTVSGKNKDGVDRVAHAIKSHYLNVITNTDPLGVEYAMIIKNVIGIACGIAKGLNYGDNFLAVVVSNAMREVKDFLLKVDEQQRDLFDSAYFGDLLVTAYSKFSRNRNFGYMIGRGYSVITAETRMTMVTEGFPAVKGLNETAISLGVRMPVLSTVYRILYCHSSPFTEFKLLESQLK